MLPIGDSIAILPLLVLHIGSGLTAIAAGTVAAIFKKGSPRHRSAGNVFVVAMLCLAGSGAIMGFIKDQPLNGCMGLLTIYLVITAWRAATQPEGSVQGYDRWLVAMPLAVGIALYSLGVRAANGLAGATADAGSDFIFGTLALLFAAGDVGMLLRGGVSGASRIARHLWRMGFAFFIAEGSLFFGQQQVFPAALRGSFILALPTIVLILFLGYWMMRVKFSKSAIVL